jgi:hypothetical protein
MLLAPGSGHDNELAIYKVSIGRVGELEKIGALWSNVRIFARCTLGSGRGTGRDVVDPARERLLETRKLLVSTLSWARPRWTDVPKQPFHARPRKIVDICG